MESKSRIYNSKKNISYGLIVTVINILVSFVSRTFFVKYLGPEFLGLNGLFVEVVTMLSLAELGVGMAINYSLYKPIHENDYPKINQLMSLFKKTYDLIALVVFVLGLCLLPFIHLIVKGTYFSHSYIRLVFILFVVNTSVSYLFSYNTSFVTADQKQYVVSVATAVMKLVFTIFMVLVLILTQNYILYLILVILLTVITNIIITCYVRKKYPFIDYKSNLPEEERKKVFGDIKNIFVKRVSGVVTSSTTNILISTLVNTIQVGLYSNYTMFFSMVRTLNKQFSNGIKASIGDLTVSENSEKCIQVLRNLTFLFFSFSFIICSLLYSLCGDFITIWLGKDYLLTEIVVFISIVNLFIEICCEPLWQYLEVSGLFRQDRNIAILGSTVNLAIAIILGLKIGMAGIFLGTLFSQIIQMVLKSMLLFNHLFSSSSKRFVFFMMKMFLLFIIILLACHFINRLMESYQVQVAFIIKAIITITISFTLYVITFRKSSEYVYTKSMIISEIKKRK